MSDVEYAPTQTLIRRDEQSIAPQQDTATFMAVIAAAARDPQVDVAKMQQLLEMSERLQQKEAEVAFNRAMSRVQPKLPVITKRGRIRIEKNGVVSQNTPFAKYEDIDRAIRPLLCAEGFSLSFDSHVTEKGTIYEATLSHELGHSRKASIPLPSDTSGSKNAIQAIGSTTSYARRYLTTMLLNIVTIGEDDDGRAAGFVDEKQVSTLTDMIAECELDGKAVAAFLKFINAPRLEEIQRHDYDRAMQALRDKLARKQRGEK